MKYRIFGRIGWQISDIGFGMWGIGGALSGWTGANDEESMRSLERAVQLGCNFFDTAWAYGDGHSERLLGQLLVRHSDKRLYVATKIPPKNLLSKELIDELRAHRWDRKPAWWSD